MGIDNKTHWKSLNLFIIFKQNLCGGDFGNETCTYIYYGNGFITRNYAETCARWREEAISSLHEK